MMGKYDDVVTKTRDWIHRTLTCNDTNMECEAVMQLLWERNENMTARQMARE